MSTFYYLACHEHKEICEACSSVGEGFPLGHADKRLPHFIYRHRYCDVKIISEHDPEYDVSIEEYGDFCLSDIKDYPEPGTIPPLRADKGDDEPP